MAILEIHGIADAEKAMAIHTERQEVTVTDDDGKVLLSLSRPPTAGMSPMRARFLAKQLIASAGRVEKAKSAAKQIAKAV